MTEIPEVGMKAPGFSVSDQNGDNVNLKDLNGKISKTTNEINTLLKNEIKKT